VHRAHTAQTGRTEEVSTPPPLTLTPPQQVCLNFLVDMWSEADVETAATAASAAPTAADVGPLVMGPVAALLLGRCRGHMRLFLPLRC
jgi:hypothetical protein